MTIYIDGDACPKPIKAILFKAANRTKTKLILVANQFVTIPKSPFIQFKLVSSGFDIADNYIVEVVAKSDLVITADIPLADRVIDKGAIALNPRGNLYTKENIKLRLGMRDLMDELRGSGMQIGGPKLLDKRDIGQFANALDQYLAKL